MFVWKKYFTEEILKRGLKYYQTGKISEFFDEEGEITSSVVGTEEYSIKIKYNPDKIISMDCNCPYAEEGNYCKHMAAVLFYRENGAVPFKETKHRKNKQDNLTPFKSIETYMIKSQQEDSLSILKKQLYDVVRSYKRRGGIEYYDQYNCVNDLVDQLEEQRNFLLGKGKLKVLCRLSLYALEKFEDANEDDDGALMYLWEKVEEIFEQIESLDGEILFKEIISAMKVNAPNDYIYENLEGYFYSHFNEEKFAKRKLEYIDKELDKVVNDKSLLNGYIEYRVNKLLAEKIKVLHCLEEENEIQKLHDSYFEFESVQQDILNTLRQEEKYKEMVILLKKIKKFPLQTGLSATTCREQLMEIYKIQKDAVAYRKELLEYILEEKKFKLPLFIQLKSYYESEEWIEIREQILQKGEENSSLEILELYNEEKLYDRLIDAIDKKNYFDGLIQYKEVLQSLYQKRMLDIGRRVIEKDLREAIDRNGYQKIAQKLRKLALLKEGNEVVGRIIENCKDRYPRRKALLEELSRIAY